MAPPCAIVYATIYYSFHKETQLLHIYITQKPIFYLRLIDDAIILMQNKDNNFYNKTIYIDYNALQNVLFPTDCNLVETPADWL